MTKWEHDYYKWSDIDKCILTDGGGFVVGKSLDEMGEEEWELVCINNGIAYFKRSIVEDIEMPIEANGSDQIQEMLDKLNSLKFAQGYFGDWQHKREEVLNR